MSKIGDVLKFDFQADVFRGEYRLIEDLGKGLFIAEHVEPSDELIAEATKYYLESESPYLGYHDPFGPERREATRQEALDEEILKRIDYAGETFRVELVSAARYAEMF